MTFLVFYKGNFVQKESMVEGCRWHRLDEPVFVAALDFRMTRVGDYEKFYAPCVVQKPVKKKPALLPGFYFYQAIWR